MHNKIHGIIITSNLLKSIFLIPTNTHLNLKHKIQQILLKKKNIAKSAIIHDKYHAKELFLFEEIGFLIN